MRQSINNSNNLPNKQSSNINKGCNFLLARTLLSVKMLAPFREVFPDFTLSCLRQFHAAQLRRRHPESTLQYPQWWGVVLMLASIHVGARLRHRHNAPPGNVLLYARYARRRYSSSEECWCYFTLSSDNTLDEHDGECFHVLRLGK